MKIRVESVGLGSDFIVAADDLTPTLKLKVIRCSILRAFECYFF